MVVCVLKLLHVALCITDGRHKIQSVGEWLDSLGLGQYENTLVANGFDDTDFLVSTGNCVWGGGVGWFPVRLVLAMHLK